MKRVYLLPSRLALMQIALASLAGRDQGEILVDTPKPQTEVLIKAYEDRHQEIMVSHAPYRDRVPKSKGERRRNRKDRWS